MHGEVLLPPLMNHQFRPLKETFCKGEACDSFMKFIVKISWQFPVCMIIIKILYSQELSGS